MRKINEETEEKRLGGRFGQNLARKLHYMRYNRLKIFLTTNLTLHNTNNDNNTYTISKRIVVCGSNLVPNKTTSPKSPTFNLLLSI